MNIFLFPGEELLTSKLIDPDMVASLALETIEELSF